MPVRPSKVLVVSPVILFDMQEANEKKKKRPFLCYQLFHGNCPCVNLWLTYGANLTPFHHKISYRQR